VYWWSNGGQFVSSRIAQAGRLLIKSLVLIQRTPVRTRLPPWRRSADRTRLRSNSLLTGNFTGKITISGPGAVVFEHETAALQGLLGRISK
jgi:hypothetical protein